MIGKTVSHYKILEKLGGGGMGVVYKAEDIKLKRPVALKFLPPDLTRDEEAKQRFINEAQAASALDHPNIAVIYEIGETEEGELFIAMAFYDGETLKKKIAAGPQPVDRAIDIAAQVVQGLARAHEAGITHRDIKPANLMVTNRGEVKIVDFGLAKMAHVDLTKPGSTLGTAAYMSPEQARGEPVDYRTDIWALGVVLYEMLAGQLPFRGEYEAAVAYSILNEEPKMITGLRADVPPELESVVNKCLEKMRENRYQNANELLVDLQKQKSVSAYGSIHSVIRSPAVAEPIKLRKFTGAVLGLAAILLVAFLISKLGVFFNARTSVPRLTNPRQITSAIGLEDSPSWSPDGGRIAYESNQSGNWDIWVKQISGGEPVNLTSSHSGKDRMPSWSPDGSEIAFWSERDGGAIFVIPAIGGAPRYVSAHKPLVPDWPDHIRWSQDGKKLARMASDSTLEIFMRETGATQRVRLPGTQERRLYLNWAPDGRTFAYVDAVNVYPVAQAAELWIFRVVDVARWKVTDREHYAFYPSWPAGCRKLYFISNRGGTTDLWQISLDKNGKPADELQQVTTGLAIRSAIFSPDGTKLAYSKGRKIANIWRVPIPKSNEPPATWSNAERMTFDQAYVEDVTISPDASLMLFSSDRAGNQDLWSAPVGGSELRQLTTDPAADFDPVLSPDGRKIAFYSYRSGKRDIWVMPATGGPARQLTRNPSEDFGPAWSPDGLEIAFGSVHSGKKELWVISAEGGEARHLTTKYNLHEMTSLWWPDGKWLSAIFDFDDGTSQIGRISAAGGSIEFLTRQPSNFLYNNLIWSVDHRYMLFIKQDIRARNIWGVNVADGSEKQLTDFRGRYGDMGFFALATDGRYLYFAWEEEIGDIWVMDVKEGD